MGVKESKPELSGPKEFVQNQFDFTEFGPIDSDLMLVEDLNRNYDEPMLFPMVEGFSSKHSRKDRGEKYLSVRTPRPRYHNYGYRNPYNGYGYYPGVTDIVDPSGIYNPIPVPSYNNNPYYNPYYNPIPVVVPSLFNPGILPFPPDGISGSFNNMVRDSQNHLINPYYGSVGIPDYSSGPCGGTECNYYPGLNNRGFNSRCSCCSKGTKCRNPKKSPYGVKYQDCCKDLKCKTTFSSDTYGHCQ